MIYVTDSLKCIAENTAKRVGGSFPKSRFAEIFKDKNEVNKSGDEIAAEIIKNAGLVVS